MVQKFLEVPSSYLISVRPHQHSSRAACFTLTKFIPLTFYGTLEWEWIALEPKWSTEVLIQLEFRNG